MPDNIWSYRRVNARRIGPVSHRVLAIAAFGAAAVFAAEDGRAQEEGAVSLPPISVEGQAEQGYKPETSASPKITTPLRETPQTINVVPREVFEDRGATTLRDVLRNVPGISIQAGEGGIPAGDGYTVRGFNARTDTFIDGVRDFGNYFRDPFNLERVEVYKGPNSAYAGRGSTGGAINQVSKTPLTDAFASGAVTLGTDQTKRLTADINQPLTDLFDDTALRFNVMGHDSDVAERDVVEKQRWGFAPSITFGLTSPTKVTLSYFHLSQRDVPDRGHPFVNGEPAPVDRENFYGIENRDYFDAQVDILSAEVTHRFSGAFSLRNLTRYGYNATDYVVTNPSGVDFAAGTITPTTRARDMENTILINQTDLTSRFQTAGIGHTLVTGIEFARETTENRARSNVTDSTTSLFNPNPGRGGFIPPYTGATTEGDANSFAVYAVDTIDLTEQWSLLLGGRWDYFDAEETSRDAAGTQEELGRTDKPFSWRAGVTYKPLPYGSIYAAYGTSFNPSAERLNLSTDSELVEPEKTRSYEVGTKWDVFRERLSLSAAVFRIEKTNARTPDPLGGLVDVLEGEQRVDGFEIGIAGSITPQWRIYGGYTYLDGEVIESNDPEEVGKPPRNTAEHSFSIWTTYMPVSKLEIGFGAQYLGERIPGNSESAFGATSDNTVPDYLIFDAMVSYRLTETVALQLNGLNLTDEEYYDASYSSFAVPGAGRTFLLSTSFRF